MSSSRISSQFITGPLGAPSMQEAEDGLEGGGKIWDELPPTAKGIISGVAAGIATMSGAGPLVGLSVGGFVGRTVADIVEDGVTQHYQNQSSSMPSSDNRLLNLQKSNAQSINRLMKHYDFNFDQLTDAAKAQAHQLAKLTKSVEDQAERVTQAQLKEEKLREIQGVSDGFRAIENFGAQTKDPFIRTIGFMGQQAASVYLNVGLLTGGIEALGPAVTGASMIGPIGLLCMTGFAIFNFLTTNDESDRNALGEALQAIHNEVRHWGNLTLERLDQVTRNQAQLANMISIVMQQNQQLSKQIVELYNQHQQNFEYLFERQHHLQNATYHIQQSISYLHQLQELKEEKDLQETFQKHLHTIKGIFKHGNALRRQAKIEDSLDEAIHFLFHKSEARGNGDLIFKTEARANGMLPTEALTYIREANTDNCLGYLAGDYETRMETKLSVLGVKTDHLFATIWVKNAEDYMVLMRDFEYLQTLRTLQFDLNEIIAKCANQLKFSEVIRRSSLLFQNLYKERQDLLKEFEKILNKYFWHKKTKMSFEEKRPAKHVRQALTVNEVCSPLTVKEQDLLHRIDRNKVLLRHYTSLSGAIDAKKKEVEALSDSTILLNAKCFVEDDQSAEEIISAPSTGGYRAAITYGEVNGKQRYFSARTTTIERTLHSIVSLSGDYKVTNNAVLANKDKPERSSVISLHFITLGRLFSRHPYLLMVSRDDEKLGVLKIFLYSLVSEKFIKKDYVKCDLDSPNQTYLCNLYSAGWLSEDYKLLVVPMVSSDFCLNADTFSYKAYEYSVNEKENLDDANMWKRLDSLFLGEKHAPSWVPARPSPSMKVSSNGKKIISVSHFQNENKQLGILANLDSLSSTSARRYWELPNTMCEILCSSIENVDSRKTYIISIVRDNTDQFVHTILYDSVIPENSLTLNLLKLPENLGSHRSATARDSAGFPILCEKSFRTCITPAWLVMGLINRGGRIHMYGVDLRSPSLHWQELPGFKLGESLAHYSAGCFNNDSERRFDFELMPDKNNPSTIQIMITSSHTVALKTYQITPVLSNQHKLDRVEKSYANFVKLFKAQPKPNKTDGTQLTELVLNNARNFSKRVKGLN